MKNKAIIWDEPLEEENYHRRTQERLQNAFDLGYILGLHASMVSLSIVLIIFVFMPNELYYILPLATITLMNVSAILLLTKMNRIKKTK